MSQRRPCGVTLIELLVVLAIIAVLAGVLMPVFATAREKSRQASCCSNGRQISLGLMMYAHDYDGRIMQLSDNDAGDRSCRKCDKDPSHFKAWYDWIQPYVRSQGILRCPSYGGPWPVPDGWPVKNRYMRSNYALSGKLMWTYFGMLDRAPEPASMMMVSETPGGITWFNTYGPGWTCADILMFNGASHLVESQTGTDDWGSPAIRASVMAAAADGHVKSIHLDNLKGGTDGPWDGLSCWNSSS